METKFTKGDWRVDGGVNGKGFDVTFNDDGEVIADYVYEESDAHLIAAAPEMYKHINQDIEILERQCKNHVIGSYEFRSLQLRIKSKQKLLAKARGE